MWRGVGAEKVAVSREHPVAEHRTIGPEEEGQCWATLQSRQMTGDRNV